jgi:hypothetical protein
MRRVTKQAIVWKHEAHRSGIEAQIQLGRNAVNIYQDLVESHGFEHHYSSVKRFVHALRSREPKRFNALEFLPGEEAQVDYGEGALTRCANGRHNRPKKTRGPETESSSRSKGIATAPRNSGCRIGI